MIFNTTPHDCHVYRGGECVQTIISSKEHQLRVPSKPLEPVGMYGEILTVKRVQFQPFTEEDRKIIDEMNKDSNMIIASTITAEALKAINVSAKILVPCTDPQSVVRDNCGRIIGVRFFEEFWAEHIDWTERNGMEWTEIQYKK